MATALLLAWASSRKAKVRAGEEKQAQLSRDGQVNEFASARQVVKAQVLDEAVTARWREAQHQSIEATLQRSVSTDRYRDLGQMLAQGATILMVTVGALAILNQEMTMGALIAANMLSGRVTGPLNMLVGQWRTLIAYRQARLRLDMLFQSPIEKSGGSVPLAESRGELQIQHLQFRYPGAANDALVGLNGRVGPGGLHGLVGPNGSGKTTLLKILAALYHPSEGRVLLDGADIAQFARRDLAQWIGYLPQTVQPFAGTIRENITMGWPQATDDDVRRAGRPGPRGRRRFQGRAQDVPVRACKWGRLPQQLRDGRPLRGRRGLLADGRSGGGARARPSLRRVGVARHAR